MWIECLKKSRVADFRDARAPHVFMYPGDAPREVDDAVGKRLVQAKRARECEPPAGGEDVEDPKAKGSGGARRQARGRETSEAPDGGKGPSESAS